MATLTDPVQPKRYTYDFQDPPNALAHNGVESVSIYATSADETPVLCTFRRSQGSENEPLIFDYYLTRGKEPPARPPSSLPPPGHLSLRLYLGPRLGYGRAGGLFPPLVAKISRPKMEKELEHEAFYYDEMETIQGIVIPRCYGFFTGVLPSGCLLPGESDPARDVHSYRVSSDSDESTSSTHASDSELKKATPSESPDWDLPGAAVMNSEDPEHAQYAYDPSDEPRAVSILLLEQLGDRLPIGEELPVDIEAEVLDMYNHLVELGIDHTDIRHANILEAPICPPGWPSLMSPLTNNAYRYRLVDFDNACKTNRALEFFPGYYQDYVRRLMRGLRMGYVFEPWEL
ncbi:hypothetical protein NM688_g7036 [Phlebia brevispora]|uniref:Uncharacterized protein n=1 Tax=Phlebia brevispora TaxID=194682 RepID=A0ACC1S9Q2_9APHY|nr:hypothetical protein NM688_g7036 [Phlebia brevispora]